MAIRNEDWNAINDAIDDRIATAIECSTPHGWRRVTDLVREWGIAGAILTVIVALLALAAGAFYQAMVRVDKQARFETDTANKLTNINKDINQLKGDIASLKIKTHVALPPDDFNATLGDVAAAVGTLRKQRLQVSHKLVEDLGKKLANAEPASQGFWPATGQFISYRSLQTLIERGCALARSNFAPSMRTESPICTNRIINFVSKKNLENRAVDVT